MLSCCLKDLLGPVTLDTAFPLSVSPISLLGSHLEKSDGIVDPGARLTGFKTPFSHWDKLFDVKEIVLLLCASASPSVK